MNLPIIWAFDNRTIREQALALRARYKAESPLHVFNKASDENAPSMSFLPPWIGGAEVYCNLAQLLPGSLSVGAFEPYNLYTENKPASSLEELAALYIDFMKTKYPLGPYILGGWSAGGVIAYEMAQQLIRQSEVVKKLYLINTSIYSFDKTSTIDKYEVKQVLGRILQKEKHHYENLPQTYRKRLEDAALLDAQIIADYKPKPYLGEAVLFKATKLMADNTGDLRQDNGLSKYIKNLEIKKMDTDHVGIMYDINNNKIIVRHIENEL